MYTSAEVFGSEGRRWKLVVESIIKQNGLKQEDRNDVENKCLVTEKSVSCHNNISAQVEGRKPTVRIVKTTHRLRWA